MGFVSNLSIESTVKNNNEFVCLVVMQRCSGSGFYLTVGQSARNPFRTPSDVPYTIPITPRGFMEVVVLDNSHHFFSWRSAVSNYDVEADRGDGYGPVKSVL
tara:strand:- start:165 stop:470 length:306 start_codon:yes stop_codon:yes gene_type:complete